MCEMEYIHAGTRGKKKREVVCIILYICYCEVLEYYNYVQFHKIFNKCNEKKCFLGVCVVHMCISVVFFIKILYVLFSYIYIYIYIIGFKINASNYITSLHKQLFLSLVILSIYLNTQIYQILLHFL